MTEQKTGKNRASELGLRFASAGVLIPIALAMVWFGNWWLATGCAAFAAVMAWEWSQISGYRYRTALAAFAAAFCLTLPIHLFWLSAAVMTCGLVFLLVTMHGKFPQKGTAACGLIYITAMVGGLYFLREGPWQGLEATLYFMCFVWTSDAAAYFTGRGLGGPRLWPSESPNKTWSGAIGAVVMCAIFGLLSADIEGGNVLVWGITGVLVSVIAQIGDLFESGLKRRFKVKDAGNILPGHGGVLDRVDGLGAVAVFGSLALYFIPGLVKALGF